MSRWMRLCFVGHVAVGWTVYNACPMDRVSSWCHISCPSGCPLLCSETICTACTPHHTSPLISLWLLYPHYLHASSSCSPLPFLFTLCVVFVSKPDVNHGCHSSGAIDPGLLLLLLFVCLFFPRPVDGQLGWPRWPASPEVWLSASPVLGLQAHATTLVFLHGDWRLNMDHQAHTASIYFLSHSLTPRLFWGV